MLHELNQLRRNFVGDCAELIFNDDQLKAQCFLIMSGHLQRAICTGFSGNRKRPDFNLSFKNDELAREYCSQWSEKLKADELLKVQREAEKKANNIRQLVVGDVMVCSWGYEQTNINYYQVTRLVGACSVEIRAIARQATEQRDMSGECTPLIDEFIGEPMVKRVEGVAVKIFAWGAWARKQEPVIVDGKAVFEPKYFSNYA
ncbi:hypothetical protein ACMYR3_17055 (plasmid) [Ampullimonas aquatilis]|uniref:hypothetical protein n=1 Tax=Ampullimonas aquatilis TaxID=1341549 RepID=UPI003C735705